MNKGIVWAIVAVVVIGAGAYFMTRGSTPANTAQTPPETQQALPTNAPPPPEPPPIVLIPVTLNAENNSGEQGIAKITEENGKAKVEVTVSGEPQGSVQPAHIHVGTCPGVGAVKYPLSNIVNGSSTTMLDVSFDTVKTGGALALNIHKSAKEAKTYVACGLVNDASQATAPGQSRTTVTMAPPATAADTTTEPIVTYGAAGFTPATVTIKAGEKVKFVNDSSEPMWVASNPHPSHTGYPGFDEKASVAKGASYEFTFSKAGIWGFHNHLNPGKQGKVVVQ